MKNFIEQLFPDFEKELADCEVMLTVGVPAPYDAMVIERNGSNIIVFDMGRFLSYKDPQGFAQQMMTHETAHAMLHKKWQLKDTASYQEQLRFLCFDEGFAHLLPAAKKSLPSMHQCGYRNIMSLPLHNCIRHLPVKTNHSRKSGCIGLKLDDTGISLQQLPESCI